VGTLLARIERTPPSEVINRVGGVVVRPMELAPKTKTVILLPSDNWPRTGSRSVAGDGDRAGGRVTKKDVQDFVARSGTAAQDNPTWR